MTVIQLAARLLRLPTYAMNMTVTIRDQDGVDHADLIGDATTGPRLNFEFTDADDEAIWRELGGKAS